MKMFFDEKNQKFDIGKLFDFLFDETNFSFDKEGNMYEN